VSTTSLPVFTKIGPKSVQFHGVTSSITGYNIIEAKDLDAAVKIAQDNPYIASIRVYVIREM
jgi:hypothetical protein